MRPSAVLGGVALLGGLLLLVYLFVNTEPAKLARALKWIALGAAVLVFLYLLLSERFAFIWLPLTLAFPYLRRMRSLVWRVSRRERLAARAAPTCRRRICG